MDDRIRVLLNVLVNQLFNMVDITGVAIIVTQMLLKSLESHMHNDDDEEFDDTTEYWIEDEVIAWCYQIGEEEATRVGISDCKECMALIEYKDFINMGYDDNNNNDIIKVRNNHAWNSNISNPSLLFYVSWTGFFHQDVKRDTNLSFRIETTRHDIYAVMVQNGNDIVNMSNEEKEVNSNVYFDEVLAEDIYIWDDEDYDLDYNEQSHEDSVINIFTEYQDVMDSVLNQEERETEKDTKDEILEQKEGEEHYRTLEEKEIELIIYEIKRRIKNHLEHNAKYTLYKDSKKDFVNRARDEDKKVDQQNQPECTIQSNEDKMEDKKGDQQNQCECTIQSNEDKMEDKKGDQQNQCECTIQSNEDKMEYKKGDQQHECECTIQSNKDKIGEHTTHEHNDKIIIKEETKTEHDESLTTKVMKEEIMPVLDTKFTVGEPLDININYIGSKSKLLYLQIPFTSNFINRSLKDCKAENENETERKLNNGCKHLKPQKHCKVANCRDSVYQRKTEIKRTSVTTIKIKDMKNKNTNNVLNDKNVQKCIVLEPFKLNHTNSKLVNNSNAPFQPKLNHEHTIPEPFFKQGREFHVQTEISFSPKLDHKHTIPQPFHFDNYTKESHPNHDPFIPELKHQHTMPKPFELIEKHDSELQARKQAKVQALLEEEQKKMECESIKCRPAPHFGTPFKPKLSHKCTQPRPFGFLERSSKSDNRSKGGKRSTAR